MVRARVQDGVFVPMDPIPVDWTDGHEVVVEDADRDRAQSVESWIREFDAMGPAEYEPGEWEQVQEILREADEQSKSYVRRERGLEW